MNKEEPKKKEKLQFRLREDLERKHIVQFIVYVLVLAAFTYLLYRYVI